MHTSSSHKVIFVVPTKVGTQGLQSLALGPRVRGDDEFVRPEDILSPVRGDNEFVRREDIPAVSFGAEATRCVHTLARAGEG
jgi:hypothetical protein